MKISALL